MKVYVGRLKYIYDDDEDFVVATTQDRIEQELIAMARRYLECMDEDHGDLLESAETFDDYNNIGWRHEWYYLGWERCDVLSDEHILKYAMETI
tara:strand:+ start:118 stop:396 length:279 start_codon:yes stop_codon:yes gene_type:complete